MTVTTPSAVVADSTAVTSLTHRFGQWADERVDVDRQRRADMALAIYEGLSNCADHAYRGRTHPGTMSLQMAYHPTDSRIGVCITDHGTWKDPHGRDGHADVAERRPSTAYARRCTQVAAGT